MWTPTASVCSQTMSVYGDVTLTAIRSPSRFPAVAAIWPWQAGSIIYHLNTNHPATMFSPLFSFAFSPSFAAPFPTADNAPSPDHIPAIQTTIPDVDLTVLRPVFNPDSAANARLPNPGTCTTTPQASPPHHTHSHALTHTAGTARANTAPSIESPAGTPGWAQAHAHQTVLQQHCAFFDADADGVVWPHDTFRGLRALGFGLPACAAGTLVTHALFSYPTCAGRLPDPLGRIWLARVHRCKHGSDSGVFDGEGRFVPQKFEDFFAKYGQKEGIHSNRLWEAVMAQRLLLDPVGWLGAAVAWLLTYTLLRPDPSGFIKKEDIRRVFDGSIFDEIVRNRGGEAGKSGRDVGGDKADAGKRTGKKGGKQKED
ncbi:Caleosin related protein-domain-containing protein [Ganoderma leucocontextum]|nr:Caleosin related protein-domain-containing protein [Ganoderma leucocontextum]